LNSLHKFFLNAQVFIAVVVVELEELVVVDTSMVVVVVGIIVVVSYSELVLEEEMIEDDVVVDSLSKDWCTVALAPSGYNVIKLQSLTYPSSQPPTPKSLTALIEASASSSIYSNSMVKSKFL